MGTFTVLPYIPVLEFSGINVWDRGVFTTAGMGPGGNPMHSAWTIADNLYSSSIRCWFCVVGGRNVYFASVANVATKRAYKSGASSTFNLTATITPTGYGTAWYGDNSFQAFDYTVEPFETLEEAAIAFLGGEARRWNIKYIPINCSLTGVTSTTANTEVNVTINPYPQATLVGSTVYYSGGRIESTLTGNTLTFTTPSFPS